jgi:hypothetical protein
MSEPSTFSIQGVPATIRRSDLIPLIGHLGIDVYQLTEMRIGLRSIQVTLKARNADGKSYQDDFETNAPARHIITIPIVDE